MNNKGYKYMEVTRKVNRKVIAAGHVCVDMTPTFHEGLKVQNIGQLLQPGALVQVGGAHLHTGGAVANTGLAMKIFGADVTLMGKIGKDAFGDLIIDTFDRYQAKHRMIRVEDESTSYTIVLSVPGIDRSFLHNPGPNDTFTADDVPEDILKDTALFHFGYPPLMAEMYRNDGWELVKMMEHIHSEGVATSLDMAAVDADSEAGSADWKSILKKVLPFIDFFVPSIEELCFMLDRERWMSWQKKANGRDLTEVIQLDEDIRPLADECMACGCKVLFLKCGAPGLYLRTAGEDTLGKITPRVGLDTKAWADMDAFEKSYRPKKVLSGTGAGDTSIAAFLTAVLNGDSPENCLNLAAAAGASCVEAYDALSGLGSLDQLRQRIHSGWEKNT